ncbi:DUF1523 family protein [Actibacterium pelagium]|uniref:DUF1523 domain-containing protein n=1 Tax=Actibacterium pelagium TaxID=2029103 RepID=A0A917EJY1_9RHOB|nr:DUF1523 family protein [Actibacterium pelagium]GGE53021.1 hypothetical protein GCM10011517_21020 [Actibacterium pelagium]
MAYVKMVLRILLLAFIFGFLHYTLPQRDIVRVIDTYEERQDLSGWTTLFWSTPDTATAELINRDVMFIRAVKANGKAMVYRNEDTGWGWPPYFKFDTATLQTEIADTQSTKNDPEWVAITHYGWRNEFLSIFPNAIGVKPVAGPDVRLIPWVNIVILTGLLIAFLALWRAWRRFRMRTIDPLIEDVEDTWDAAEARADEAKGQAGRWWDRLRGR